MIKLQLPATLTVTNRTTSLTKEHKSSETQTMAHSQTHYWETFQLCNLLFPSAKFSNKLMVGDHCSPGTTLSILP
jgi:hypothetical protein